MGIEAKLQFYQDMLESKNSSLFGVNN